MIHRHNVKTRDGNVLAFFYNDENDLLVVDLVHGSEEIGNEIVRMTLNETKLFLAHKGTFTPSGEHLNEDGR